MKFSCSKDIILDAVTATSKAASSKSTIPALEGLLLELENEKLIITGYNLEIGIRTEITVSDCENGSAVINASMLSNIIRKMPSGILNFNIDENSLAKISIGQTEMTVMCYRADEYPPVPQTNGENGLVLSQKVLKSMIVQTKYACSTVDTKPALTGCLFEMDGDHLNVVATDGIRIALRCESIAFDNIKFIVPSKTLEELIHLLSDEEDKNVSVCIDKNQISFEVGSYTMISRLINGDFLDYKKHMVIAGNVFAEINCREIIEVLERTMLLVNEKNKIPVRCQFEGDKLQISCSSSLGKINDNINIKYNGDPVAIGFNAKFLLDAFKAADTDKVKILLGATSTHPVIITPMESSDFMFFLLPMRLK